MSRRGMGTVVAGIQTLFSVGTTAALSDGQLLERFLSGGDESAQAAFACLVERHGPMVMRVCRGVLHDGHAAEDAFQVTFLVLARKARSIRKHDSIASWLFGVARRVARKARAQNSRRALLETGSGALAQEPNPGVSEPPDCHEEIHQEVDRLPDRYRAAVVLCYFEGLTKEQAAVRLAVPAATIKTRLARARERLKRRLVQRGLVPSVFTSYASDIVYTTSPRSLVEKTVLAAFQVWSGRSAGLSASAAALFEGMKKAMLIAQLKAVGAAATVLLASGLIATSLAVPARLGADPDPQQPPPIHPAAAQAPSTKTQGDGGAPKTVTLKKGSITRTTRVNGRVNVSGRANLSPGHTGVLTQVMVAVGQKVRKGQVLAVVEAEELNLAVEKAASLVDHAEAHLARARAEALVSDAVVRTASAKSKANYSAIDHLEELIRSRTKAVDRRRQHVEDGQRSTVDVDEVQDRLDASQTDLASARSQIAVTQSALDEAQSRAKVAEAVVSEASAEVRTAKLNLRKAQSDLDSMTLKAPWDGVVSRRTHEMGEVVLGEKGEPLLTIAGIEYMRYIVLLPERDAAILKLGDSATLEFRWLPGKYQGTVLSVADSVDPDGLVSVEFNLANPDGRIREGQPGRAEIALHEPPDTLVIPSTSILDYQAQTNRAACFRLVDGKAVKTLIMIDFIDNERAKVLEGLNEGDVVIANPAPDLANGQKINVKPAP